MNTVAVQEATAPLLAALADGCVLTTAGGQSLRLSAAEVRQHPELGHAIESVLQFRSFLAEQRARRDAGRLS